MAALPMFAGVMTASSGSSTGWLRASPTTAIRLRVDPLRHTQARARDVVPGDHVSGSMSTFTMSFQAASRPAPEVGAARRKGV